jgi:hypothetical protein
VFFFIGKFAPRYIVGRCIVGIESS